MVIVEKVTVGEESALAQHTTRLFQDQCLLRKLAEVVQCLNRYDGVDFSCPPHFDEMRGPVFVHQIGAAVMHSAAAALFAHECFETMPGEFEQVRRQVKAAVMEI